jgi:hypothetical protein
MGFNSRPIIAGMDLRDLGLSEERMMHYLHINNWCASDYPNTTLEIAIAQAKEQELKGAEADNYINRSFIDDRIAKFGACEMLSR